MGAGGHAPARPRTMYMRGRSVDCHQWITIAAPATSSEAGSDYSQFQSCPERTLRIPGRLREKDDPGSDWPSRSPRLQTRNRAFGDRPRLGLSGIPRLSQ